MDIQFQVNGKTVEGALAIPSNGKGPGVLVLHAWWGLKPIFKNLCERLAEQGFVAFAPDLNSGEIAQTPDEAMALMERRDFQRTGDVVMAAKDYLLAHPACTSQKIGVIGFSMGGAWALVVAARHPELVSGVVLFYAVNEVDFGKVQAKVLGHFSDVDEWEPLEGVRAMEKAMQEAGVDATIHIYSGKSHWFVEEDRPEYDPEAAKLAWERTFAFLKSSV